MRLSVLAAIMLLSACGANAPRAAASSDINPARSSDSLRASRSLAPASAIAFDIDRREDGERPSSSREAVTLADSFVHVVTGPGHTLYDRGLCRMLRWTEGEPTLSSLNCHAVPIIRVFELSNRRGIAEITRKIGAPEELGDPYWPEAELGVQDRAADPLVKAVAGEVTEYRLAGDVVVRIEGSAGTLEPVEARRLAYWLGQTAPLHPQVRRDLAVARVMPKRLEIATAVGGKRHTMTLTISNLTKTKADYPLPSGLTSDVARDAQATTPRGRGVEQAVLAAEGKSRIPKPEISQLVAAMRKDVADNRMLDAQFRFSQLIQQYGGRLIQPDQAERLLEVRSVAQGITTTPDVARLRDVDRLAGDPREAGDREAAARFLIDPRLAAAPFGTFRHVSFANLVSSAKSTEAWDPAIFAAMPRDLADNYWTHIAAYPWASNAYADLGFHYLNHWNPTDAWLAFDLGRAVDPDWRLGVIGRIEQMERKVRADHPDLF